MDELFDKYGKDTILAAISQIFDETEQKCRNVVVQLPDGIYEAEASIDDDGLIRDEEVPVRVKITIKGSDMTIDLSGCSAERKAAINSRTYAGARVAYKALTGPLDPVNEFGHDKLLWLDQMVLTSQPLREKMTLFWHDHSPRTASRRR